MAKKPVNEDELSERYVAEMLRHRPRKPGAPTYDIAMSNEGILGDVRYVLLTGNEPFDRIVGGFPFGRITEVFGLENCGKTALMVRSMCRFQVKHVYEVVSREGFIYTLQQVDPRKIRLIKSYIDNEHSLEKGFKIAINDITYNEQGEEVVEHITMACPVAMCDTVDHIFGAVDSFITLIKQAEKEEAAPEGEGRMVFGLFLVDTIAGTSSKEELERAWGDRDYPRQAQQISEGFRCVTNDISRHNVAMVCTNQVRTKFKDLQKGSGYRAHFSTPQSDDFSTFGGKALSFWATHRVFMFQMPIKYALVKGAQFPAGYLIGFRTLKNRLRKPGREARMVLLFDEERGGLHNVFSILESMIFLRVAEMSKSGEINFKFKKFKVSTTTFAENVVLEDPDDDSPRKRKRDPFIEGRYEWLSFYRAHRSDLDKLWEVAMRRAYETPGLSEFYEPEPEDDDDEAEDEESPPAPRRRVLPTIGSED